MRKTRMMLNARCTAFTFPCAMRGARNRESRRGPSSFVFESFVCLADAGEFIKHATNFGQGRGRSGGRGIATAAGAHNDSRMNDLRGAQSRAKKMKRPRKCRRNGPRAAPPPAHRACGRTGTFGERRGVAERAAVSWSPRGAFEELGKCETQSVCPASRTTGYFRSTIFRRLVKEPALSLQKYRPLDTSAPRSSRPFQSASWAPAASSRSTSARTRRPAAS